jgi:hypothetical protein
MQRIVTTRDMGDGLVRTRVRIEGDPCEPESVMSDQMRQTLLTNIADNPALIACGNAPFQVFKMFHDNTKWVIEVEATRKNHVRPESAAQGKEGRG